MIALVNWDYPADENSCKTAGYLVTVKQNEAVSMHKP